MVGLFGKTVGERMSGRDGELNGKLGKALRKNKRKVEKDRFTPHVRLPTLQVQTSMSFKLTLTSSEN